ncbi:hypothetical protein [Teredinibacter sp. KSP-S5-2]|uniref:hypothetical protein n=1 Tax=Teredinibacter sp. KSP-S5-2 TaxID=3034506 RepID=UPI002934C1A2|nr:hypothetical protein [Teredinibacter sp. KSP-S5-2]WNO11307.1 hypothetical protein P5V12_08995 [Teredinibacter sp. KSP-S5-2]
MKNLSKYFSVLTFIFASICSVSTQALLIENNDSYSGSIQIQYASPVGQSFNATDTDIGSVGIYIVNYNQWYNDLTITMSLYSGVGDFSSDALLTSSEINLTHNYIGWVDLDVSSLLFDLGSNYTIGLTNNTAQRGVRRTYNDYAEGTTYYSGSPSSQSDLTFRIRPGNLVNVPEPVSLYSWLDCVWSNEEKIE